MHDGDHRTHIYTHAARAVVSQSYVTEAENEYVIRANSAIMKCKIPSFVSEFIYVDQWMASDGSIYTPGREHGRRAFVYIVCYVCLSLTMRSCLLVATEMNIYALYMLRTPSPFKTDRRSTDLSGQRVL